MNFKSFKETIENAKNIIIFSHVNPDGDTLGSMCALYQSIKINFNKDADMVYNGIIPEIYNFTTDFVVANLSLAVFNLLPIYPLDGFNAIASQLSYTNKFVTFMQKYGSIILLVTLIVFNYTNLFSELVYYISYPINKFWTLILF